MEKNKNKFLCNKVIKILNKNFKTYIKYRLKDHELEKSEFHFLYYICNYDNMSQKKLTNINHVDKSTTTRNLKKLLKHGYIERTRDPKDKRKYLIKPTKKGIKLDKHVKGILTEWNEEIINGIDEEKQAIFREVSNDLIKNSKNLLERTIYEKKQ